VTPTISLLGSRTSTTSILNFLLFT